MYVLEHPLGQQQQNEPRQAQHPDHQGVPHIEPQGQPGDARRHVHRPQCHEAQQRVAQQPHRQAQRCAENADQGNEKEGRQQGGQDLLIQVHTLSPSRRTAAAASGLRSLMARIR